MTNIFLQCVDKRKDECTGLEEVLVGELCVCLAGVGERVIVRMQDDRTEVSRGFITVCQS